MQRCCLYLEQYDSQFDLAAWGVPWSRVRKGDRQVVILDLGEGRVRPEPVTVGVIASLETPIS